VNPPSPAIVAQSAVRRLPRLALWLFCLGYVLPGFFGREPWKNEDVATFGAMLGMAHGTLDWWRPEILNQPLETPALFPYWLGAWAIQALPFLSPETASRLPYLLLLGLTLAGCWYAVYQWARLPQAQPVSFAFGGEANPLDYARTLADAALLALIACLGLAQLSHETTPALCALAFTALLAHAAARLGSPPGRGPRWGTVAEWTVAVWGLAFSGTPVLTGALGLGLLALLAWPVRSAAATTEASPRPTSGLLLLLAGLTLAAAIAGLVLCGVDPFGRYWDPPLNGNDWHGLGQLLVWFTWPAWPLALWTLWRWRHQLRSPHVALPLWMVLASTVASALQGGSDRVLLMALPGLACLAAFALPTLRRSVSAFIDWFALLFFTGCALVIWVIWLAMMTGVPAKPAANVARLAPGFEAQFSLPWLLPALAATLAWVWLVSWRVGRHRAVLWKSLILPAAGSTLCWLLLMSLWLPLLDHGRSYGPMARRIELALPGEDCVLVHRLTQAQIVALQYHGHLRLKRLSADPQACGVLIVSPEALAGLSKHIDLGEWNFEATVPRLNDRRETLLIYRRR
jgi:hypothetical protein